MLQAKVFLNPCLAKQAEGKRSLPFVVILGGVGPSSEEGFHLSGPMH